MICFKQVKWSQTCRDNTNRNPTETQISQTPLPSFIRLKPRNPARWICYHIVRFVEGKSLSQNKITTHCLHKMPVPSARANPVSPVYPRLRCLYMVVARARTISRSQCYHLTRWITRVSQGYQRNLPDRSFMVSSRVMDGAVVGMVYSMYKQEYPQNNTQVTFT
jgi:hypothetical protein